MYFFRDITDEDVAVGPDEESFIQDLVGEMDEPSDQPASANTGIYIIIYMYVHT